MTKLTKLALEQINTRLAAENAELRKQILDLQLDLSHANAQIAETDEKLGHMLATEYVAPRVQRDVPSARLQAMQLAREMAMRSGRIVKV